jgi:hypothetical protein
VHGRRYLGGRAAGRLPGYRSDVRRICCSWPSPDAHSLLGWTDADLGLVSLSTILRACAAGGVVFLFESSLLFVNASYFGLSARQASTTHRTPLVHPRRHLDRLCRLHGHADADRVQCGAGGARHAVDPGGAHGRFRQAIERSGLAAGLGPANIFTDAHAALREVSPEFARRA